MRRAVIRCVALAARSLREGAAGFDAVISTHPFASQAIGRLVDQGRMNGTVSMTYLTDLSVHSLWISPSVTRHLALHEVAAEDAARLGARGIAIVRPAVRRAPTAPLTAASTTPLAPLTAAPVSLLTAAPTTPLTAASASVLTATPNDAPNAWSTDASRVPAERVAAARAALGLPPTGRLALITGGAEGVGDLEAAAADVLASTTYLPVVLCARNETLRRRLERHRRVVALGWVSDMPTLYDAVDVVVQNAGGSTSLEALAADVPIISYRCLPGHGETNAANLERAGLVPWVRTLEDLPTALGAASARTGPSWAGDCVARVITESLVPTG